MRTIYNLKLCEDCVQPAVNDDWSSLDYHYSPEEADKRIDEILRGLDKLGPGLCWDSDQEDDEFSIRQCDCCGSRLAGRRVPFTILGEEDENNNA